MFWRCSDGLCGLGNGALLMHMYLARISVPVIGFLFGGTNSDG